MTDPWAKWTRPVTDTDDTDDTDDRWSLRLSWTRGR